MSTLRGALAGLAALAWLVLGAQPAFADVTGPCTVTATATSTGPVDVGATDIWHIRTTDELAFSGVATVPQTGGSGAASAFGFEIPLVSGTSDGETSVDVNLPDAAFLGTLGRVFVVSGTSSGPGGGCTARLTVVLDDVNPFTTVLGGAALGMSGLALLGVAIAVRRPDRRVVVGVLSTGLFGGALGLLLQQTSTPGAGLYSLASGWAASVISPAAAQLTAVALATSAGLAGLFAFLMPFPSELFNRTLEANEARIAAAVSRIPLIGRLVRPSDETADGPAPRWAGLRGLIVSTPVILLGGLLYGLLDPAFGLDARSLVTYVGILVGMVLVTWAIDAPRRAVHRRLHRDGGWLRAVPWTLAFAAICVAVSRLAAFQPGYLFGLLIGLGFRSRLTTEESGRTAATGAAWLVGLGVMAWFGLGSVRTAGIEPGIASGIAESVLAALMVAAIEGAVIGYIPMRFLPGAALFRWSRVRWALAYLPGLFLFWWVLVNPAGAIAGPSRAPLLTAIGLFVAFGIASVLFWSYFRFRRPTAIEAGT